MIKQKTFHKAWHDLNNVSEKLIVALWVTKKKINNNFSSITYVVGTQKNHLIEMVLLSTQNIC